MDGHISVSKQFLTASIQEMEKQLKDKSYMEAFPEVKSWLAGRISAYKTLLETHS